MKPSDKVRAILDLDGWKQERLAERLGVAQSTVNRVFNGKSDPRGELRDKINLLYDELFGDATSPHPKHRTVPLVGYVGAGAAANYFAAGDGNLGKVPAPDDATPETVAVEIRGESLGSLFDQWIVYYDEVRSPVTPDLIGRLCVVGLPDERVLIKQIKRSMSPDRYHLLSNTEPPLLDVAIEWAAKVKGMVPR